MSSVPQPEPSSPGAAGIAEHAPVHGHGKASALVLAALGVVYGDIGTSPLYALKECVHGPHAVPVTADNVYGLLSLMLWSVLLVVSFKYLTFIMRADNDGEGGILALMAMLPSRMIDGKVGRLGLMGSLVLFGAALLYGDGIITPAISVLSAVEGLGVATNALEPGIVPITVAILVGLFAVQKRGTQVIGRVFGPIMVVWFGTLLVLGAVAIAKNPGVLAAANPLEAVSFFRRNGFLGFTVLGSVVLCITGGEALYADMGHFGRRPIQIAWYFLVLPALVVNYFGQGATLLSADAAARARIAENPFYALVPQGPWIYGLVALATMATVIASQALISGAYSLSRQAVQLGFLPRVTISHTSHDQEGQIYIKEINSLLAVGCILLVLGFQESTKLAAAYGIAVTGTMGITSLAFYFVARTRWGWSRAKALPLVVLFLVIDLAFFGSNLLKFFHGGFVPIVVAAFIFAAMTIWKRGRALLGQYFVRAATPLGEFLRDLSDGAFTPKPRPGHEEGEPPTHDAEPVPVTRVPGVAVFLTSNADGTPPLLLHHVRHVKALHRTVLLVTVLNEHVPRVTRDKIQVDTLEQGFYRVRIRTGFMESTDVPRSIETAIRRFSLPFSMKDVTYFLGRETLLATSKGEMGPRAESLFAFLTRNSQAATRFFGIPPERVVEIGMQVDL